MNLPARIFAIIITLFILSFHLSAQDRIWKQIDGLYGGNVRSISFGANGQVFAVTDGGLYRSVDNCRSWSMIGPDGNKPNRINAVAINPSGTIIVSSIDGLYYSTDQCSTWQKSTSRMTVRSLFVDSAGHFYGFSYWGGIISSTDEGKTWSSFALDSVAVTGVQITRRGTWFAECDKGLYRSMDNGTSWTNLGPNTFELNNICELNDGTLFGFSTHLVLYRSDDKGATWTTVTWKEDNIWMLFIDRDNRLIVGTFNAIYVSTNKAATWTRIPAPLTVNWTGFMTQDASGNYYGGSHTYGVCRSVDGGRTWVQSAVGMTASMPMLLCESHSGALFAEAAEVLYVSRDDGSTWAPVDVKNGGTSAMGVVDLHGHIFLAGWYGVLRSDDDGASWTLGIGNGPYNINFLRCTSDGVLFAATGDGLIYRSMDEGQTWSQIRDKEYPITFTRLLLTSNGSLLTVRDGKILRSTDKGATWQEHGSIPGEYWSTATETPNGALIAATANGLFVTADEGVSWTPLRFNDKPWYFYTLTTDSSGSLYAACGQTIYISIDNGATAIDISKGITADIVRGIVSTSKGYLFATTGSYGLYRTIDPVKPKAYAVKLPTQFSLEQNYPNPFNPSTTMKFSLATRQFVSLKVYDVLGKEAATIVNEERPAGNYSCQWNASGFPSGVYFYRLQAGAYTETKRLILLR